MPHRSIRAWFCLATAFLAVLAMLLSVVHVQSGHNAYAMAQTETQRHVELAAAIAENGHAHDEGEPDERLPGHVHGPTTPPTTSTRLPASWIRTSLVRRASSAP